MDLRGVVSFTDYFIICSGTSDRMLSSLVDAVMKAVKKEIKSIPQPEGRPSGGWLIVDLGDIVVHFFSPDQRDYYQLEKLWDRGKVLVRLQ